MCSAEFNFCYDRSRIMTPSSTRNGAALIVGVSRYQHAERIAPLAYAARDAQALADVLSDPDVCGFPPNRVKLLTNEEATRDALYSGLSHWLVKRGHDSETVVLFFAGHGLVQAVGHRDEGFLLPYDADPEDVGTKGVRMSEVGQWLSG